MKLAPKTKLFIGIGVFTLVVLGLLSLRGGTFSGNLSLIPRGGNPELCAELARACTAGGNTGIACENHQKLCAEFPMETQSAVTTPATNTDTAAPTTTEPTTNRRARPRGAAPELTPRPAPEPQAVSADELSELLKLYPESSSQGQLDTSTMR